MNASQKLAALLHTLRSFGIMRVSLNKARTIARAMNEAVGGAAGARVGNFWIWIVDSGAEQIRLCVPVEGGEQDGAIVSLNVARPVAELEAAPATSSRSALLATLRAEIARLEAPRPLQRVKAAPARALPAGESDLSMRVKIAGIARQRPAQGSAEYRALRAS